VVARTFTVPLPAGLLTVHCTVDMQLVATPGFGPKSIAVDPTSKLLPLTVTNVPPVVGPLLGLISVITGAAAVIVCARLVLLDVNGCGGGVLNTYCAVSVRTPAGANDGKAQDPLDRPLLTALNVAVQLLPVPSSIATAPMGANGALLETSTVTVYGVPMGEGSGATAVISVLEA